MGSGSSTLQCRSYLSILRMQSAPYYHTSDSLRYRGDLSGLSRWRNRLQRKHCQTQQLGSRRQWRVVPCQVSPHRVTCTLGDQNDQAKVWLTLLVASVTALGNFLSPSLVELYIRFCRRKSGTSYHTQRTLVQCLQLMGRVSDQARPGWTLA